VNNIHSEHIKVANLNIHYFTGGQGDPLVVVHGGGGGAGEWLQSMTELCEHHRIYVPDLPGFGRSQPLAGKYGISEFVDFLEGFTHALGLKRFHLVGHSLGGGIAMRYAVKFPHKVAKLVLVNSMSLGREIALWIRFLSSCAVCRSLARVAVGILEVVKGLVNAVYAPLKFANPLPRATIVLGAGMTLLREQATTLVSQFSKLRIPTLLVWGVKDNIVPVSQAYAAARLIPDCQLHVFEDAGHSVYREKVKEFSHLLTTFLG
jgi:pimeloyl-ACP methyl ester carboxylesterase